MLFSVGIDPETTRIAHRIGDSSMNPTTPINPCLLWVVTPLTKYIPSAGIGTLASMTIPMALGVGVVWMLFFLLCTGLGIPLGPRAGDVRATAESADFVADPSR